MRVLGDLSWESLAPLFGQSGLPLRARGWLIADAGGVVQAQSSAPVSVGQPIFESVTADERTWLRHEWARFTNAPATLTIRWADDSPAQTWHSVPYSDGVALAHLVQDVVQATGDWPLGVVTITGKEVSANPAAQKLLEWTATPNPQEISELIATAEEANSSPIYYPRTALWLLIQSWGNPNNTTVLIQDVTRVAKAQIEHERFAQQAETVFRRQEVVFYVLDPISGEAQLTGCWPGGTRPEGNIPYDEFLCVIHPEDREKVERWHVELLPAAEGVLHHYRVGSESEGYREVCDHMHLIGRTNGSGTLIVGTIESAVHGEGSTPLPLGRDLIHTSRLVTLGELSASLAHEVNNPLAALAGHAELLASHECPEVAEAGKQIQSLADRAARMVARTRRLSSANCSDAELVDVPAVVRSAAEMVEHTFRKLEVHLEIVSDGNAHGFFSPTDLEQVIVNLMVNARDAVEKVKEPRVTIAITNSPDSVQVRVSDNGPGIPKHKTDEIFTPFFSTKGAHQGTGLGLSISRRLMEVGCGSLELEPTEQGASFVVSIPNTLPQNQAKDVA